MANVWVNAIPIFAGNLNSGLNYLITTVKSPPEQVFSDPTFVLKDKYVVFWWTHIHTTVFWDLINLLAATGIPRLVRFQLVRFSI